MNYEEVSIIFTFSYDVNLKDGKKELYRLNRIAKRVGVIPFYLKPPCEWVTGECPRLQLTFSGNPVSLIEFLKRVK